MFANLSGESIVDDPKALPSKYISVWKNPYRCFGLDENSSDISTVRQAFRKLCLAYTPYFSDVGSPKVSVEEILFAYHKIRGHLPGTAKEVADTLKTNPYLSDFRPEDILPLLRPMPSTFPCAKEYRAFRMLTVVCKSSYIKYTSEGTYLPWPQMQFVFDVHYCLRKLTVEHSYIAVLDLHNVLSEELVAIPSFPTVNLQDYFLGLSDSLGSKLAAYMMRIHVMLAGKSLFSARLLKFLGIDFERVQSEEEGIIMSLLDTPSRPRSSACHHIDEAWLDKWRKFVMGRGARRYYPPGPINNYKLKEQMKIEPKTLRIVNDYRVVCYNVWRFYELVHGGGPCISTKEEDIYSPIRISYLHAVIRIQLFFRILHAKFVRERLFMKKMMLSRPVRAVLLDMARSELNQKVDTKIKSYQDKRKAEKLREAAMLTQGRWRRKKAYDPEENLRRHRDDQFVFTRTSAMLQNEDPGSSGEGLVVEEPLPIIRIGRTTVYERRIEEDVGMIPFEIKRVPGSEMATIWNPASPTEYIVGSKLISLNGYPCSAMDFETIKVKLKMMSWPLVLELERPFRTSLLPTVEFIVSLENEILQYNAFKLLLVRGIPIIKHNSHNSHSHASTIKLSEFEFFYRGTDDAKKTESQIWRKLSLFDIKFIRSGRDSELFAKKEKQRKGSKTTLDRDLCFEIVVDGRDLCFELPAEDVFFVSAVPVYQGQKEVVVARSDYDSALKAEEAKSRQISHSIMEDYVAAIREVDDDIKADRAMGKVQGEASVGRRSDRNSRKSAKTHDDDDGTSDASEEETGFEYDPQAVLRRLCNKGLVSREIGDGISPEDIFRKMRGATIVSMFQMLVDEIRKAQNTVDDLGIPTRRTSARMALRKINP